MLSACAGNPTHDILTSTGLGPKTAAAQDFVVKSRQESITYIPVGTTSAGPSTAAKNAQQVKEAESELDNLREKNANAGAAAAAVGGTPPPDPVLMPKKAKAKPTSNK